MNEKINKTTTENTCECEKILEKEIAKGRLKIETISYLHKYEQCDIKKCIPGVHEADIARKNASSQERILYNHEIKACNWNIQQDDAISSKNLNYNFMHIEEVLAFAVIGFICVLFFK